MVPGWPALYHSQLPTSLPDLLGRTDPRGRFSPAAVVGMERESANIKCYESKYRFLTSAKRRCHNKTTNDCGRRHLKKQMTKHTLTMQLMPFGDVRRLYYQVPEKRLTSLAIFCGQKFTALQVIIRIRTLQWRDITTQIKPRDWVGIE